MDTTTGARGGGGGAAAAAAAAATSSRARSSPSSPKGSPSPGGAGAKKSKKQLQIEAAAAAAEEYNRQLVAKARARQAAIDGVKKAEADERRRIAEEIEEAERLAREEQERLAREEAAERARQKKIAAERKEAARIQALIDAARGRVEAGCAAAAAANKRWPNRVLEPAPHTTLRRLRTDVLDALDKELPFEDNDGRDFMLACSKEIFRLEVATYPTVHDLVDNHELHVEASLRFQKWFGEQTAAGRYVTYQPPPYNPATTKKYLQLIDGNGTKRGPWTCAFCKTSMDPEYCRCKQCGASYKYALTKVERIRAKTESILAAKAPGKQKLHRGIQHWIHGNKPDGFHYEDYM